MILDIFGRLFAVVIWAFRWYVRAIRRAAYLAFVPAHKRR